MNHCGNYGMGQILCPKIMREVAANSVSVRARSSIEVWIFFYTVLDDINLSPRNRRPFPRHLRAGFAMRPRLM
jgi:hypothetical protein